MAKKTLHLLWTGNIGGIEKLCLDIARFSDSDNVFCFVHAGGLIYEEMRQQGFQIHCLSYSNKDLLFMYRYLREQVTKNGVTSIIVHHDAPLLWLTTCAIKKKFPSVKLLVYAHCDYTFFVGDSNVKRYTFSLTAACCDRIIAISESVKKGILAQEKNAAGKITVVYNGIDLDVYRTELVAHDAPPLKILYLGRLIEQKGVQLLLQAIHQLPETMSVCCDIVGDGQYRPELERLSAQLGMEEIVCFHGSQRNVCDFYRNADVFVHPAICEEGFGITLAEAMATGLPCIAFDRGAICELITPECGFVATDSTAEALADAIRKVYGIVDKEEYIRLRENAVNRAGEFSVQKMVKQLEALTA